MRLQVGSVRDESNCGTLSWGCRSAWCGGKNTFNVRSVRGAALCVIGAVPGDSHHLSLVPDSAVDDAWGDRRTTVRAGTGFPQKMLFPSSSLIPVTTSLFYALSFFFPMLEVL